MSASTAQISLFFATIGFSIFTLWWLLGNKKKNYVHVGKVSRLFFFPVKSLKGIEISSLDCVKKGAHIDGCDDRCYMLISGDGFVCTQRQEPSMVLLTPSISGNHLHISGPEMETLVLDLKPSFSPTDKILCCRIFTEEAPAYDCGDEAAAWFQKYLNRPDVRLVYTAEGAEKRRCIRDNKLFQKIRAKNAVSFQDFAPFHVVNQKSVDDLNSNIEEETRVSVNNFRPNILIDGHSAFDEDKWRFLKFSSGAELNHLVPCGRCVLTTNDPETGIKTNKEPLVTLRKYRAQDNETLKKYCGTAPRFGVYFSLVKEGKVAVGDDVFAVLEHKGFKY